MNNNVDFSYQWSDFMSVEIMYFIFYVSIAFFVGLIGVFSNPSPCFGTFFLVVSSGVGCGIVAEIGASFSALLLFLIYLGGMLVVFAYSVSFC